MPSATIARPISGYPGGAPSIPLPDAGFPGGLPSNNIVPFRPPVSPVGIPAGIPEPMPAPGVPSTPRAPAPGPGTMPAPITPAPGGLPTGHPRPAPINYPNPIDIGRAYNPFTNPASLINQDLAAAPPPQRIIELGNRILDKLLPPKGEPPAPSDRAKPAPLPPVNDVNFKGGVTPGAVYNLTFSYTSEFYSDFLQRSFTDSLQFDAGNFVGPINQLWTIQRENYTDYWMQWEVTDANPSGNIARIASFQTRRDRPQEFLETITGLNISRIDGGVDTPTAPPVAPTIPDTIPSVLPAGIPDPVYPGEQEPEPQIPDVIPQKLPAGIPDPNIPPPEKDEPPPEEQEPPPEKVPQPTPTQPPAPIPAPVPNPIPGPIVPASVPAPAPIPPPPAPAPAPIPAPGPVPHQNPVTLPGTVVPPTVLPGTVVPPTVLPGTVVPPTVLPGTIPNPNPNPNPIPAPGTTPLPSPYPYPLPVSTPGTLPAPIPNQTPAPVPNPIPGYVPNPIPNPSPNPGPQPVPLPPCPPHCVSDMPCRFEKIDICNEPCIQDIQKRLGNLDDRLDLLDTLKQLLDELLNQGGSNGGPGEEERNYQQIQVPYADCKKDGTCQIKYKTVSCHPLEIEQTQLKFQEIAAMKMLQNASDRWNERTHNILGGDAWFKGEKGKSLPESRTPKVSLDPEKNLFFPPYESGKGGIIGSDGKYFVPELNVADIPQLMREYLRVMYMRSGLHNFPAQVPKTLLGYTDAEAPADIPNLAEFISWFTEQFDAVLGKFPVEIEIEDVDPITAGKQKKVIELPNVAEAVAEFYALALSSATNGDVSINFLMRLAAEIIGTKNASIVTQDHVKAISSFLGYRGNTAKREVDYAFNPTKLDSLDELLQNSKGYVVGWKEDDPETVVGYLQKIVFVSGILKEVFFRSPKRLKELQKELESMTTQDKTSDDEVWKKFVEMINNPDSLINSGDVPNPKIDTKPTPNVDKPGNSTKP